MPIDQDTIVKLMDAKIDAILAQLEGLSFEEKICILENLKLQIEACEFRQMERDEAKKKVEALEVEAATPA